MRLKNGAGRSLVVFGRHSAKMRCGGPEEKAGAKVTRQGRPGDRFRTAVVVCLGGGGAVEMRRTTGLLVCLGLVLGLAACETGTNGEADAEAQPVVQYQPEPELTPRERLKKAISLLEKGEEGQAGAELDAYLAEVPDSRLALDLKAQIAADPVAVLGPKHFLYKMQPGDSISSVAKRMLGDPLKFYILARYNNLENPSEIEVGQTIRVPGSAPPKAVASKTAPKEPQKAVKKEPQQAAKVEPKKAVEEEPQQAVQSTAP
ncbi:MAG: LysM peptidoglycan-binding domain-containing protein, partial [Kiloniellales bacterium]|nr:LysM peptidoglycan-binding domain-containing protein [Kiloniellales bacterium]